MQPHDSTHLQSFMERNAIRGEIVHLDVPTPTVETAAQAVGVRPEQIVKSILFLVDQQPVLAIVNGTAYVERRVIAGLYGVGKKRVRLASPEEVQTTSGYEVGAMPPFGHIQPLPTLLERGVLELPEVYAGGGDENALLRICPQEIARATGARVIDLLTFTT
jgi:prolyl-tRNA editing enzyme YbaK/EbsC (Cys-tRNA(Pro) deacylase)